MNESSIQTLKRQVDNFSKLSVDEQILYMKYKGITFNHIDENNAKILLSNNTYYYKVTAFRKNFSKQNNRYVNVDFGILNDLATIDMYLRYVSIKLLLDIEHKIKSDLIHTITTDRTENGYSIVREFDEYLKNRLLERNPSFNPSLYKDISKTVMNRNRDPDGYHYDIYIKRKDNPPIWVLLELMSFGELIRFIEFYYETNKYNKKRFKCAYDLLKYIKNFRDSSAHSRPLILNLTQFNQFSPGQRVTTYAKNAKINKADRKKYFSNKKIHDFTCILILHDYYISTAEMKTDRKNELNKIKVRCLKRSKFYRNHSDFKNIYKVFSKIIDYYHSE